MNELGAVRRARWATAAIFLVNGAVIGTWAAHIPLVETRLAISHATLGVALLVMAAGALIAMPLTGGLTARLGSAPVIRGAMAALLVALPLPLTAPSLAILMTALFFLGAANGALDVAMNAHGVLVERRIGRAIMSSLHGMWSVGGLAGAGLAALLFPLVAPFAQVAVAWVALTCTALLALRFLLPAGEDRGVAEDGGVSFAWPRKATIGLGLLCFLALSSEGAILDWSALHLDGRFDLGPGFAATGYAAFSAAMASSRFLGDWMRGRFGAAALVRWSALLAAAGLVLALTGPWPVLAVAGFALVGLGLANLVPVFFGAAGRLPGEQTGGAIAAVATFGYTGFLLGPPVIGFAADLAGLGRALGLIVLACLAVGASAHIVRRAA